MEMPKDIPFDPNKSMPNMVKGSKAAKKYFRSRSKK